MIKPARPIREPLQDYRNRDYVLHLLDERVFDALNKGSHVHLAFSGCIDALETLPSGSMVSVSDRFYDASHVTRGISAAQEKEFDDFMKSL